MDGNRLKKRPEKLSLVARLLHQIHQLCRFHLAPRSLVTKAVWTLFWRTGQISRSRGLTSLERKGKTFCWKTNPPSIANQTGRKGNLWWWQGQNAFLLLRHLPPRPLLFLRSLPLPRWVNSRLRSVRENRRSKRIERLNYRTMGGLGSLW